MLGFFTGKYYLVDTKYSNKYEYLDSYKIERNYLQEFRRRIQLSGREEVFNHEHLSLHNIIECFFGIWK
jgi:hypothetical protein